MDADNIWCPVSYDGHAGRANAAYLGIDLQGHSTAACELYPRANGCGVPPGLYDEERRAAHSAPLWGPAIMPSANERVWYTASMNFMFRKGPDPLISAATKSVFGNAPTVRVRLNRATVY